MAYSGSGSGSGSGGLPAASPMFARNRSVQPSAPQQSGLWGGMAGLGLDTDRMSKAVAGLTTTAQAKVHALVASPKPDVGTTTGPVRRGSVTTVGGGRSGVDAAASAITNAKLRAAGGQASVTAKASSSSSGSGSSSGSKQSPKQVIGKRLRAKMLRHVSLRTVAAGFWSLVIALVVTASLRFMYGVAQDLSSLASLGLHLLFISIITFSSWSFFLVFTDRPAVFPPAIAWLRLTMNPPVLGFCLLMAACVAAAMTSMWTIVDAQVVQLWTHCDGSVCVSVVASFAMCYSLFCGFIIAGDMLRRKAHLLRFPVLKLGMWFQFKRCVMQNVWKAAFEALVAVLVAPVLYYATSSWFGLFVRAVAATWGDASLSLDFVEESYTALYFGWRLAPTLFVSVLTIGTIMWTMRDVLELFLTQPISFEVLESQWEQEPPVDAFRLAHESRLQAVTFAQPQSLLAQFVNAPVPVLDAMHVDPDHPRAVEAPWEKLASAWRSRYLNAEKQYYSGKCKFSTPPLSPWQTVARHLALQDLQHIAAHDSELRSNILLEDYEDCTWTQLMWYCTGIIDTVTLGMQVLSVDGVAPAVSVFKPKNLSVQRTWTVGIRDFEPLIEQVFWLSKTLPAPQSDPNAAFERWRNVPEPSQRNRVAEFSDTRYPDILHLIDSWRTGVRVSASTQPDFSRDIIQSGRQSSLELAHRLTSSEAPKHAAGWRRHLQRTAAQITANMLHDDQALHAAIRILADISVASARDDGSGEVQTSIPTIVMCLLSCLMAVEHYVLSPCYAGARTAVFAGSLPAIRPEAEALQQVLQRALFSLLVAYGPSHLQAGLSSRLKGRLNALVQC